LNTLAKMLLLQIVASLSLFVLYYNKTFQAYISNSQFVILELLALGPSSVFSNAF